MPICRLGLVLTMGLTFLVIGSCFVPRWNHNVIGYIEKILTKIIVEFIAFVMMFVASMIHKSKYKLDKRDKELKEEYNPIELYGLLQDTSGYFR